MCHFPGPGPNAGKRADNGEPLIELNGVMNNCVACQAACELQVPGLTAEN